MHMNENVDYCVMKFTSDLILYSKYNTKIDIEIEIGIYINHPTGVSQWHYNLFVTDISRSCHMSMQVHNPYTYIHRICWLTKSSNVSNLLQEDYQVSIACNFFKVIMYMFSSIINSFLTFLCACVFWRGYDVVSFVY